MFLCVSKGLRFSEVVDAARAGVDTPDSIRTHFGFDDDECCERCAEHIESVARPLQVKMHQFGAPRGV